MDKMGVEMEVEMVEVGMEEVEMEEENTVEV